MSVLWRSVVGKLWMTIIGLVAVVLFILTILLVQFFDHFFFEEQNNQLELIATKIADIIETYDDESHALHASRELVEVSQSSLIIIGPGHGDHWGISADPQTPIIDVETLYEDEELHRVFMGETIKKRQPFPVQVNDEVLDWDVIIVAVPIKDDASTVGAVFLYQSLDVINETINATKRLIVYAAVVGIFLTTFFAFFLSTRITYPLRQMKAAATNIIEGDFKSRVSIRSKDEIGDLARTFNLMASRLNDSIHALSHEKEQLSNILKSMVDGVLTLNNNGQIIIMNPPAEKMINLWKFEENIEKEDEVPRVILDIFEKVVQTEKEYVTTIAAQGRFWTIAMAPLYNMDKVRGTVAVIRDMTEEIRLDKLRKDFVANVSHEIRTPLVMLQGYSEALIDDVVDSPEERKELAQIIHEESLRMGRLVNELLDLARIQAGHVELNLESMPLSPVIQRIVRKFINLAKENKIVLVENIQNTQHSYSIDSDRMEQILTNLIDNAIRHTPAEGEVLVSLTETNEGATIIVKDTGHGIPSDDLPFIFERFYKADKARTRGKAGTGLGLAIAKQLVEAHHGHIDVHSKVGEGTTFTIFIPAN